LGCEEVAKYMPMYMCRNRDITLPVTFFSCGSRTKTNVIQGGPFLSLKALPAVFPERAEFSTKEWEI
jgi:hypothetical protein